MFASPDPSPSRCIRYLPATLMFAAAFLFPDTSAAQFNVGATFDCWIGPCDANTSDQGGQQHSVDLAQHRARARASGAGAGSRSSFAEVGVRFRPCFTGPTQIGMHDISVTGRMRGFGGGQAIRSDVEVRTILRNLTTDLELRNELIFAHQELGQFPGITVFHNVDEAMEDFATVDLVHGNTYEIVLRVRARKFGAQAFSDFHNGNRGVSFDRVSILPKLPDSDGDGLPDQWEISGIDTNCDGVIDLDLPGMGASPTVKDIFLEIDWMTGHAPTQAAVRAVVEAFAAAPGTAGGTNTPGSGINLWVDTGNLTDPFASEGGAGPGTCGDGLDNDGDGLIDQADPDCLVGSLVFSTLQGGSGLGGGNEFPVSGLVSMSTDSNGNGISDFDEAKMDPARGNFDPARIGVFRYAIRGAAAGPIPEMGGQQKGNDFVLFNGRPGLLMHELGHTLGLDHGGPYDEPTSDDEGPTSSAINCKPNYISVMNYRFQTGIQASGGGQDLDGNGLPNGFILDYSPPRFPGGRGLAPLAAIDETAWDESVVQDSSDAANYSAWTRADQTLGRGRLSAQPDWDGDGNTEGQAPPPINFNTAYLRPLCTDINAPGCMGNVRCGDPSNQAQQYDGANDWDNIKLDPNRNISAGAGEIPFWDHEPTGEELAQLQSDMQATDLAVTAKTAEPDPVAAGQQLTYFIDVENLGPSPTSEVVVTDILPPELHFIDGDPNCELLDGNEVSCAIGGLEPGEGRRVEIRARVSIDIACGEGEQFATFLNRAEVRNIAGAELTPGNNMGRVDARALCARFEYAAKFICGDQLSEGDPRLTMGRYRTTVSVHNPNDLPTFFFKKLALSFPPEDQAPGRIVPIAIDELDYDEALKVDCREADALVAESESGYVVGYLVVRSPLPLDVSSVYTLAGQEGGSSIDVETATPRRIDLRLPNLVPLPALPTPGQGLTEGHPGVLFCAPNPQGGGTPSAQVRAVIRNIGPVPAEQSLARADFDGGGSDFVEIDGLAAGAEQTAEFQIPSDCYQTGVCRFRITADALDRVAESNEADNVAEGFCTPVPQ